VRRHAEGQPGERGEAHRVERRSGGEVRVQVLVAVGLDAPGLRRQPAQRMDPLLAAPAPAAEKVARARRRAPRHEPGEVAPAACAGVGSEQRDADVARRLGIGVRRGLRGVHAHAMSQPAQRLQLVDDEGLRQLRPMIEYEEQPHRAVLPSGAWRRGT